MGLTKQVHLSTAMALATIHSGIPFFVDSLNFYADIDSRQYPTSILFSKKSREFIQWYPYLRGVKIKEQYPYGETNADEYDIRYKESKLDLSYSETECNDTARYTLWSLAEENQYAWVRASWLD